MTAAVYREHDFRPGLPDPAPAEDPVPVYAAHVSRGAWVRAAGRTPEGEPITAHGPVIDGPRDLGDAVALLIRDYRAGRDVAVLVATVPDGETVMQRLARLRDQTAGVAEPLGLVELVDDPADWADRFEHDTEPLFEGLDAERVDVWRCPPEVTGRARHDLTNWVLETFYDITAVDLRALEADPDVLVSAVHWEG